MKQLKLTAAVLAGLALAFVAFAARAQAPAEKEAAAGKRGDLVLRGDAKCTRCHDEEDSPQVLQIGKTRHGVNADQRTPTCVSCHGESDRHINKPADAKERPKPDRIFKRNNDVTPPEAQSEACLGCHEASARIHWQGSAHDRGRVTCANCHTVHAPRDQVLVKETQAGVCFTCHKEQRAAIFRFSSHPLKSGWMACSDCHAPHGSVAEHNLVRNTVNETCYQCHADKRGPFLWEHPPAREDCTLCHNPHGSNVPQMLQARPPYLCQQCHVAPFHPSTNYSGTNLPPIRPGVTAPGFDKMLGQQCMNCHSKVHGSNHPSGARFTR
ncbi:MAG: DmsE family decaheme c-type cytochrome [Burkholderiales bacterium]|nr:DmsE family decaheme c-type cytochrome [Burkholderiales bacterium]